MNNDLLTIGTALAAAVISIAALLPKLLANFKKDKLDGAVASTHHSMVDGIQSSYEKQLNNLSDRFNKLDTKVQGMDSTIHNQAIKITRLIVVLIHMQGLLEDASVPIPKHIQEEINNLTSPPEHEAKGEA